MGVALDLDHVVGGPGFELEGAVGDDVSGLGPGGGEGGVDFPVAEDDVFWDGIPGVVLGDLGKEGGGAPEGEEEGVLVEGLGSDLGEVFDLAFVVFLGVFEEVEHFPILGGPARVGGEHALVGEDEVVRGDGDAVGPFGFGVEVEGPLGEFFVGGPFHGRSGEGGAVLGGVLDAEAFEEGADDIGFEDAGDEVGVEAFGLVAISDDEDIGFIRLLDIGLATAGCQQEAETEGKET